MIKVDKLNAMLKTPQEESYTHAEAIMPVSRNDMK